MANAQPEVRYRLAADASNVRIEADHVRIEGRVGSLATLHNEHDKSIAAARRNNEKLEKQLEWLAKTQSAGRRSSQISLTVQ